MKKYIEYICAVLFVIGTSVSAWGTTETMNFASSNWAWPVEELSYETNHANGAYQVTIKNAKKQSTSGVLLGAKSHGTDAYLILPAFPGVVSSITVVTCSGSASNQIINLYNNSTDDLIASTTISTGGDSFTFSTGTNSYNLPSSGLSTGTIIRLEGDNVNIQLASISVTHGGSAMSNLSLDNYILQMSSTTISGTLDDGELTADVPFAITFNDIDDNYPLVYVELANIKKNNVSSDDLTVLSMTDIDEEGWFDEQSTGLYQYNNYVDPWVNYTERFSFRYYCVDAGVYTATFRLYDYLLNELAEEILTFNISEPCSSRSISMSNFCMDYGSADFVPTHTVSAGSGTKTWTSGTTSVATIVDGKVHIVGAGTSTITLSVAADGTYCDVEQSCTMTVNAVAPTITNFTATATNNSILITNANASKITDKGGASITRYGYLYSTSVSTPTFGASGVTDANVNTTDIALDTKFAAKEITGLTEGTTYYVRAYAYNGTAYGYSTVQTISTVTCGKFVFACVDISVGLEDSKKVLITSRNGVNIMAVNKLLVTTDGAVDGHTVDISSDAGLKFYKKVDGVYKDLSVAGNKLTAPLTNQAVYVSYNPTSAGTGAITAPTFTIKCEGQSQTFNTSGEYVKVRNLPDAVAIAAKIGGTWHALSANITSSSTPKDISIYTSTVDGVLKAYGDVTGLGYKLWPVLTVNSTNDRWGNATSYTPAKLYGDRLRFAGKDNKGLVANNNPSSNQYNINNSGAIAAITASFEHDENYEWKVTTTEVDGQFVYKLQTDQTNNTRYLRLYNGRWGTYLDNKGVDSLYLLPVEAAALVEMEAFEWGTTDVVVKYSPAATPVVLSKVTVGSTDITAPTASMTNIGGDLWKLSGLSGLTSKPSEQFVVSLTENGSAKQGLLQIPFLVTVDNTTEQSLRFSVDNKSAIYNNVDVVIRNGGKLITGTNSGSFANLHIYPGGKAVVSHNMKFGTIFMRGGYSFLDNKATYKYPDLCVKAGTISSDSLVYDMYVDNRMYYKFSMPSDVTLASVTDETGSEDFPVWVKHYNGDKRASGTHVSGWEWYGDEEGQESFKAGVGYEITAKPKVSGRPLAIIRFPVKRGDITSDANDTARVAVTNYGKSAYDSGDLAANNVGWNFVGNPYLTAFKATSDTSMIIDKSYEPADVANGESWDGTYKWVSSPARFVTVPYDMMNDYHHEYVKNCTIPAFSAFFIQVVESGTFRMAGTRTEAAAPWRYSATQKEKAEMHVDVLLRGKNEAVEAKAGLIIHDKYEGELKDFEDVEQWFVDQNEQKTYTFANSTALAYNLLNEQAAMQIIPMGYIATAAGEHTYSLDESNDVSGLEHLWLTDYQTGVTTDLLVHGYTFTTEAGRHDERFAISAVFNREEVVTDIAGTGDDDWTKAIGVYHDGNTLTLRGLPENSSAYVYDMTGKLIASGQHLHNVASFNIAAQGVYNIRVVDGEKAVTLRSVLH